MHSTHHGFTLIEAIVSIVILGIIAGVAAVFIRAPIDAYVDTARRVALTEAADSAIRRMVRDIQTGLPNSFTCTGQRRHSVLRVHSSHCWWPLSR